MNDTTFLILIAAVAVITIAFIIAYTNLNRRIKALSEQLVKCQAAKPAEKERKPRDPKQPRPTNRPREEKEFPADSRQPRQPKPKRDAQPKKKQSKRVEELLANEVKHNGNDFEKFITQRLAKNRYFKLKGWRGCNETEDAEPLTSNEPNFLYEHIIAGKFRRFAIECKWFENDENISFANYEAFKSYEAAHETPVFFIVGVGGSAGKPEMLSIVPLNEADGGLISRDKLEQFKKNTNSPFHYDVNIGVLSEAPHRTTTEAETK